MCGKIKSSVFLEISMFFIVLVLKMCDCATCATFYTHLIYMSIYTR
nr:MAG TPA: hypothetical protein [Caudoviricetes sp.]